MTKKRWPRWRFQDLGKLSPSQLRRPSDSGEGRSIGFTATASARSRTAQFASAAREESWNGGNRPPSQGTPCVAGSVSAFGSSRHVRNDVSSPQGQMPAPFLRSSVAFAAEDTLPSVLRASGVCPRRRNRSSCHSTCSASPRAPRLALPDGGAARPVQMPLWACYTSAPPWVPGRRLDWRCCSGSWGTRRRARATAGLWLDGRDLGDGSLAEAAASHASWRSRRPLRAGCAAMLQRGSSTQRVLAGR